MVPCQRRRLKADRCSGHLFAMANTKVEIVIDDQLAGSSPSRMKFNDIRLVGPLLIVALVGALMISPKFGQAEGSVGSSTICIDESRATAGGPTDLHAVGFVMPCPTTPVPTAAPTVVPTAAPTVAPTPQPPAPTVAPVPANRDFHPRGKIAGPTWMGAIEPTVHGDQVTLQFPPMLTIFVGEKNVVRVTAPGSGTVYRGLLPSNGKITFTGISNSYTVTTELITEADYCEIVPIEASDVVS